MSPSFKAQSCLRTPNQNRAPKQFAFIGGIRVNPAFFTLRKPLCRNTIPTHSKLFRGGISSAIQAPRFLDHGLWTVDCGSLATQTNRMPQKANPFLRPGRLAPRYSWSLEFGTLPPVEAVEVNRTQSPLKNFFCSLKRPPAALLFRRAGIIVRRPENVAAVDKVFRVIHERFL